MKRNKKKPLQPLDDIGPDEVLTITLLRPSLKSLLKQIRRRNSQKSRRQRNTSAREK